NHTIIFTTHTQTPRVPITHMATEAQANNTHQSKGTHNTHTHTHTHTATHTHTHTLSHTHTHTRTHTACTGCSISHLGNEDHDDAVLFLGGAELGHERAAGVRHAPVPHPHTPSPAHTRP